MSGSRLSDDQLRDKVSASAAALAVASVPEYATFSDYLLTDAENVMASCVLTGADGPYNAVAAILQWRAARDLTRDIVAKAIGGEWAQKELDSRALRDSLNEAPKGRAGRKPR